MILCHTVQAITKCQFHNNTTDMFSVLFNALFFRRNEYSHGFICPQFQFIYPNTFEIFSSIFSPTTPTQIFPPHRISIHVFVDYHPQAHHVRKRNHEMPDFVLSANSAPLFFITPHMQSQIPTFQISPYKKSQNARWRMPHIILVLTRLLAIVAP